MAFAVPDGNVEVVKLPTRVDGLLSEAGNPSSSSVAQGPSSELIEATAWQAAAGSLFVPHKQVLIVAVLVPRHVALNPGCPKPAVQLSAATQMLFTAPVKPLPAVKEAVPKSPHSAPEVCGLELICESMQPSLDAMT
jgi:hypothetical protein